MASSQAASVAATSEGYYRTQWDAFCRYKVKRLKIKTDKNEIRFSTAVFEDAGEVVLKIIMFLAVVPMLVFSIWVNMSKTAGKSAFDDYWPPAVTFLGLIIASTMSLVYFGMRRQTLIVKPDEIIYRTTNFLVFSKSGTIPLAEITSIHAMSNQLILWHGPHKIPVLTADLGADISTIKDGVIAAIGLLNPHSRLG